MPEPTRHSEDGDWRAEMATRLTSLHLTPEEEADLADELAQHLEDRYRELRVRGATASDARRTVLDELDGEGDLAAKLADVVRRGGPPTVSIGTSARGGFASQVRQDVRYAIRAMRRSPGFSAVAICFSTAG